MYRKLAALIVAALACSGALAQTTVHYREGQRVDPRDVALILDAQPIKTRSIRLLDPPTGSQAETTHYPSGKPQSKPSALSLPVRFAFDSVEIDASAKPQLDALAEGIKMLPAGQSVLIQGHTDASGPWEYNRALSQRRAYVVKQYLVRVHGIEATRLKDSGFGPEQPIAGLSPFAGENRRVEFRGA